ncbi:hypothetical protein [Salimicrobium flavidum]|uniref:Uncharacterized protein n=1 Tax=Salimicrobium flavidum TaxID=570947 RepID=A0A1N7JJG9_9BACI|nr:hypothetical protein [Salimicrobium flavidum]SIS49467.1 hypothetical protein SAMN05421687_106151 [Salimicrobium flavidum]
MKKAVRILLILIILSGIATCFNSYTGVIGKGMLQVILPLGFVVWVNRREYWFHYLLRKMNRFNRYAFVVLFLFFGAGVLFDALWIRGAPVFVLVPFAFVLFGVAVCLFRVLFEKGFRRFHGLTFAKSAVYLIIHMVLWGLYVMFLNEYQLSSEITMYARAMQVLGGLMLVIVFFRWGRKDHKVDPPTAEGMVRKLY